MQQLYEQAQFKCNNLILSLCPLDFLIQLTDWYNQMWWNELKAFFFLLKQSLNGYFILKNQQTKQIRNVWANEQPWHSRRQGVQLLLRDELYLFSWLAFIPDLSLWWYSLNFQLWEEPHPLTNPEHTGGITYPIWPGEASGSPRQSRRLNSPAATVDKDRCTNNNNNKKKKQTLSLSSWTLWTLPRLVSGIGTWA